MSDASSPESNRFARPLYLNMSFVGQRVTGQQRYAYEISRRLIEQPGIVPIHPPRLARSRGLRWLWMQFVLPLRTWRGTLVSLTGRAPLLHPNHVVVLHDLFPITNPEWFSRSYAALQTALITAHLRFAKKIVVTSDAMVEEFRRRARPGMEFVVASPAPSEVFLTHQSTSVGVLDDLGIVSKGYLLVVGNLDPRKNLTRIVAAWDGLSDEEKQALPLVVVGSGGRVFGREDIEWPQGVIRPGYITDEQLEQLYSHARATVFGSVAEGFGLPVVEAASCGSSLVLSDIEVFRWHCGDAATYFDPYSTENIASAFRQVLDGTAAPHSEALVELSTRFSWERSADQLVDALSGSVKAGYSVGG